MTLSIIREVGEIKSHDTDVGPDERTALPMGKGCRERRPCYGVCWLLLSSIEERCFRGGTQGAIKPCPSCLSTLELPISVFYRVGCTLFAEFVGEAFVDVVSTECFRGNRTDEAVAIRNGLSSGEMFDSGW